MRRRQLPTSGEAYVCNFDASGLSGRAWEYLSVCPEERELFDDMTVEEHLLFFLFLRLVPVNTGEAYVAMLMRQLNIEQYKDTLVSALPPRVKRVVCVAITACAVEQTPLVIFPDPTRLMDPKGRHQVWEVLARLSRRSSVLVTTKSIEEAEILADRLVIMREGSVVCAGSPTWLKTRFDSGFFLRFTKLPNFRERDVTRVVKYHMGAIAPRRVSKLETVYNLSDSLHHVTRMATMLHYLEKRHDILGIAFMSLTYCTLEDVYIRQPQPGGESLSSFDSMPDSSPLLQQVRAFVREEVARQLSLVPFTHENTTCLPAPLRTAISEEVAQAVPLAHYEPPLSSRSHCPGVAQPVGAPVAYPPAVQPVAAPLTYATQPVAPPVAFSQEMQPVAAPLTYADADGSFFSGGDCEEEDVPAASSIANARLSRLVLRMVSGPEGNMGGGDTQAQSPATPADGSDPAKEKQEQDAVRQWCTARSTKAGVFSVLWALLRKRGIIWRRVWWTKPLSLGIPVACMLLLALCERHFLPDIAWEGSDITYEPEDIFDVSYGFIEKDNASKKFAENVLLPVLSEHSVRVFSPASSFVERELLFWAQQNVYSYLYEYQYGASILGDKRAVVWFNGQCPHSAPISLNLFHTALLRNLTGNKGSRITLVNSPGVRKAKEAKIEFERRYGQLEPLAGHEVLGHELELFSTRNVMTRVLYSFFVSLAMGFYAATHVFTPMVEWCSGIKHLQLMTGMSGCLYWMGHFVFDAIAALFNSATLASIIFVSNMDININYHLAILFLFVANAFASLPLTYLFTGLFGDTTWAFSFLALVLFFAGMVGSLGVELLCVITQDHPTVVSSAALFLWGFVCRWFPTYALVRGIIKVILLSRLNAICLTGGELLGEACRDSQYSTDKRISRCCDARLLYPLEPFYETGFYEAVSMVVEGMLYMIALALVDSPLMYSLRWYVARRMYGSDEPDDALDKQQHGPRLIAASMDPEVEREVNLVNQVCRTRAFKDVAMAVRNIQKVTGYAKQVDEVDGVSILLNRCECLGLIGVNNSGKTSLLEILVGIQVPSGGGAYTAALSLGGDLRAWQQGIGYAPDGIAEWCMPQLTVGEFLDLMAHLRGVAWRRQALRALLELTGRLREEQMIEKCG
ncbi:hypothetical protein HPB51_027411 [Rhipicephalus microplus]|uniref:Uncharacterized protein n=1 Tax=Rhipicephalus microplus TaxID=6941 RepID=A0A9J6D064_RHIMP|nr:hypothetical protein HPB51_027411 [Rhipicephalus microplus]